MDEDFAAREKKILTILDQEARTGEEVAAAVRGFAEGLLLDHKGYGRDEVRTQVSFDVHVGRERLHSVMDILVTLEGRPAMVIKCAPGALDSRERHAVAAARTMTATPVPIAVVMDPVTAVVLDSADGKVLGEGFGSIPTRELLAGVLGSRPPAPLAPEKVEREKRILLAFDAVGCCVPQGGDGGVSLEDPPKRA